MSRVSMLPREDLKTNDEIVEVELYNYQFSPWLIVVGGKPSTQGDWFAEFEYDDDEYTCMYHQTLSEVPAGPPTGDELWELYETG